MPSTSDNTLSILDAKYPCRRRQLQSLSALLDPDLPSPPNILVHGLEATGKSLITRALLEETRPRVCFSWVACNECITARHLTERIAATVVDDVESWRVEEEHEYEDGAAESVRMVMAGLRAENVAALAVLLRKVLGGKGGQKHVLVLDRIDCQREATPIFLAGLARLGEIVPCLTTIFILSAPTPRPFSISSMPHIHFPPYAKKEVIAILSLKPLLLNVPPESDAGRSNSPCPNPSRAQTRKRTTDPTGDNDNDDDDDDDDDNLTESLYVYTRFLDAIWESLAKSTARTVTQLRALAEKMWDEFVEPIRKHEYGTRDFSRLYVLKREMFRGEKWIVEEVVPRETWSGDNSTATTTGGKTSHDLPYFSKILLIASYLASYNPSKQDAQFFLKSTDKKRRRRGGGGGRQSKVRKINRRLLGPQPFLLERMLAVFHAIVPTKVASLGDLQTQVATLTSLRLLTRASTGGDLLDGGAKWRVNVGWDYIQRLARSVRFDVESYMAE